MTIRRGMLLSTPHSTNVTNSRGPDSSMTRINGEVIVSFLPRSRITGYGLDHLQRILSPNGWYASGTAPGSWVALGAAGRGSRGSLCQRRAPKQCAEQKP